MRRAISLLRSDSVVFATVGGGLAFAGMQLLDAGVFVGQYMVPFGIAMVLSAVLVPLFSFRERNGGETA